MVNRRAKKLTKMPDVYFNPVFYGVNTTQKRYRILKGSAGSGKSYDIAQDYILKLMDQRYKGANLLCIRKIDESNRQSTYAELLGAIKRVCGPNYNQYWKDTTSPLMLECLTTGSKIIFRGMRDDKQREKVKSITSDEGKICWCWCEEATELTEDDFDILDDRLRGMLDNPNLYYQITATFNPVSATHWIKRKFFDFPDPDVFTHSSTYLQNLFVDEQYHRRMERRKLGDPEGYKVYALAEWGILGGRFYDSWSEKIHVIPPFKIPESWPRFRSMDWGSAKPYAVAWFAADYDGNLYMYRELYGYGGKANVGTKETSRQVAQKICDLEKNEKDLIRYGVLDNACWAKIDTGAPSVAEEINKIMVANGCKLFNPSVKGREQMAEEMRLRLEGETNAEGKQIPGIRFFNSCFHAIRTIPELTQDKRDPEKVDTTGEDHMNDAIGYFLLSRPYAAERPKRRDPYELDGWNDPKKISAWGN